MSGHDEHHDRIVDLLRAVDRSIEVPPPDPLREATLLAAFDESGHMAARTDRRPAFGSVRRWIPIAAPLALAAAVTWLWVKTAVPPAPLRSQPLTSAVATPPPDLNEFVMWPGAAALPPLESGQLVRVELPASALPSLGLFPPASADIVVRADVVVGQDGLARAVRLVRERTDTLKE
jgi:hypothetical protein